MVREGNKVKNESLFFILFFSLLILNTFVRTKFDLLTDIGEVTTILTFILMVYYLVRGWIGRINDEVSSRYTYLTLALLMIVYTFSFFTSDHVDAFYFIKVFLLFSFIFGAIRIKWTTTHVKLFGYIFGLLTLLLIIHWMLSGVITHGFKSIFRNENYLAVLLFSMLYFNILTIKYSERLERAFFSALTLMNIILIVATSARSVLIGIVVIILAWVVLKQFRNKFSYLIYIVMFGNLLFVAIYAGIKNTAAGRFLNDISRSIFNKNLFSGRSEIWEGVIGAIPNNLWFGHGVGISAADVTSIHKTAHNMYLQLFLEVGVVGFVIFFLLILSIWKLLNHRLDNFVSKWSACFLLGILVYESFELTLFQNNYSIAMFQWLIITMGINFTLKDRELKDF